MSQGLRRYAYRLQQYIAASGPQQDRFLEGGLARHVSKL